MGFPLPRERDVLSACKQLLSLRGVLHFRVNAGFFQLGQGAAKRTFRSCPPGVSDLVAVLPAHSTRPGVMLACEVKRPGGRVTAAQRAFLDAVERAGALAWVISDVKELETRLTELGC